MKTSERRECTEKNPAPRIIDKDAQRIYSLELTEIKKLSEKGSTSDNAQYYTDSILKLQQKHDKNKSVINFYSDRKSNTGAHAVSSGSITDLGDNISQNSENASGDLSDKSDLSDNTA